MSKPKIRITTSFEIVSEKSIEEGGYEETGWIDEEGVEFDNVRDATEYLKDMGVIEASSECPSIRTFYRDEGEMDIYTGNVETRSYHVSGSPEDEIKIYEKLFPGYRKECRTLLKGRLW